MRALVVEDDPLLAQRLRIQLEAHGLMVDVAHDGEDGLFQALEFPFDVAVIDLGLPRLSGVELIRRMRAAGRTLPVLILTARNRWQDKVEGLDAGGDDYLVKPFEPEELQARLRALLRRASGAVQDACIRVGPLILDTNAQSVQCSGQAIELTAFEYRMLEYLVRQRERVVSKDELNDYLYPHDEDRDSNVLEVLIGRLRKKLDPQSSQHPIETLRGRGYRFRWS